MSEKIVCPICKGEKTITYSTPCGKGKIYDKNDIFDSQLMRCPNCYGLGEITKNE